MTPKFQLGQLVATPEALRCWRRADSRPDSSWIDIFRATGARCATRTSGSNDQALVDGSRLLSAYRTLKGERIWIITEAADDDGQRAASTILRPSEY